MIQPSRDPEGLKAAAFELFVEMVDAPEVERALGRAREAMEESDELRKLARPRTLASGYYDWVGYVLWLEAMRAANVEYELLASEVNGIMAVKAARREFEEKFPACEECGRPKRKFTNCRACGQGVKAKRNI